MSPTNSNLSKQKRIHRMTDSFFWRRWRDLTVCYGYALHTNRLATQILADFGTRQPLLPKNNSLNCFLNGKTLTSSNLLYYNRNKKEPIIWRIPFLFGGDEEIWTLAPLFTTYRISSADPSTTWVHLQKITWLF